MFDTYSGYQFLHSKSTPNLETWMDNLLSVTFLRAHWPLLDGLLLGAQMLAGAGVVRGLTGLNVQDGGALTSLAMG